MLPIIPIHRRYLRTCRACGNTWEVPRAVAGGGMGKLGAVGQARRDGRAGLRMRPYPAGGSTSATDEQAAAALNGYNQAMRLCNRCGVDDFDQEPLRRRS